MITSIGLIFKTEKGKFSRLKDQIKDIAEIEMEQREATVVDMNKDKITKEIPEMQITQTTVIDLNESDVVLDEEVEIDEEEELEDEHYTEPKEIRSISKDGRSYDDII